MSIISLKSPSLGKSLKLTSNVYSSLNGLKSTNIEIYNIQTFGTYVEYHLFHRFWKIDYFLMFNCLISIDLTFRRS